MTTLNIDSDQVHAIPDDNHVTNVHGTLRKIDSGPSMVHDETVCPKAKQVPVDLIEEEGMESFPASDPPAHVRAHNDKPEPRRPGTEE